MAAIQRDFDRLAALDSEGWTHNNHYHNFLLGHVRNGCQNALEIGCGTGAFARRLAERAQHVVALDLSPQMIRVARSRSAEFPNIEFHVADAMWWNFPAARFDCIAAIATLHHLPLSEMILKMREALKPGGVLIIVDLFEPERNLFTAAGLRDTFLNFVAISVSGSLRLIHNGRLKPPREVRAAWAEHGRHDSYLKLIEVRELCEKILPGAELRKHLLWRYSIVWKK